MDQPKNISTKAYVVESKGSPFTLKDVILDEVQPDEVLVEMKYTGICHTVSYTHSTLRRTPRVATPEIQCRYHKASPTDFTNNLLGYSCPTGRHAHR